jgi:hypothetical protein
VGARSSVGWFQVEVRVVQGGERGPFFGHLLLREDGFHRTGVNTQTAIDTLFRLDEKLLPVGFFSSVDTVNWTDIDTGSVFDAYTRFDNDVGHLRDSPYEG